MNKETKNIFKEDFGKTWSDLKRTAKDLAKPLNDEYQKQKQKFQANKQAVNTFSSLENKYQDIGLKVKFMQNSITITVSMNYIGLDGDACVKKDFCLATYDQNTKMMQSHLYLDSKTGYFESNELKKYSNAIADFADVISNAFD